MGYSTILSESSGKNKNIKSSLFARVAFQAGLAPNMEQSSGYERVKYRPVTKMNRVDFGPPKPSFCPGLTLAPVSPNVVDTENITGKVDRNFTQTSYCNRLVSTKVLSQQGIHLLSRFRRWHESQLLRSGVFYTRMDERNDICPLAPIRKRTCRLLVP